MVFDPKNQERILSSKITAGLERVSQAFKVLLWDKTKELGLSPIQIQLLIFCSYHSSNLNSVSFLAQEFNVTKPTISDAVRILNEKGLIKKEYSSVDNRSYSIGLSMDGKKIVAQTENFAQPILDSIEDLDGEQQSNFFKTLSKLLFQLNRTGVLAIQRTCYGCRFYAKKGEGHYCNLLQKTLQQNEIRLDCSEYESLST